MVNITEDIAETQSSGDGLIDATQNVIMNAAENVSEVFKDGREMKGRAISVGMGIVQDNGFDIEVCVNIELTAKAITETTRKTTTGRLSTTEIYDRLTEAEIYKQEKERKERNTYRSGK